MKLINLLNVAVATVSKRHILGTAARQELMRYSDAELNEIGLSRRDAASLV